MTELFAEFGLSLDDRHTHLLKADPEPQIPALAAQQQAELLVMGMIARLGIPGLLVGNASECMLRSVDCSVLALKPEGFVSPVRSGN